VRVVFNTSKKVAYLFLFEGGHFVDRFALAEAIPDLTALLDLPTIVLLSHI